MNMEFIELYNEAAKLNGHKDGHEMHTASYESDTFEDELDKTWKGVERLYKEVHAYVRNKLVNM